MVIVIVPTQQQHLKVQARDFEPSSSEEDFNEDDDEEIDEDEAFNQSDWQQYGEWFQKDADASGSADESLSGKEDDEEDEEREEGDEDEEGGTARHQQTDTWLDFSEEDDAMETSEDSEADIEAGQHDTAAEDPQHEQLLARIAAEGNRRKKQTVVLNEGVVESEDHIAVTGHDAEGSGGDLGLHELLHATQVSQADRKALQKLATGKKVVGAALPEVIRKRQQRKAAYVESSKEASKWMPLVQANRHAPTLRLTKDKDLPQVVTAAGLASKHEPTSGYEAEIAAILQESGHHNTQAAAKVDDELGCSKYSAEEWQKKQDTLARNNALLFYQESKAKRLKKIKSKAYHRHLKKKGAIAEAGAEALDDPATLQARAEEEEFRRAQERLTLKHRNTSRWARRVLKRGLSLASGGQQDALQEQLRLGQALRAKAGSMHDKNDGSGSDSSTDASDEETANAPEATGTLTTREKMELVEAIQLGHLPDAEAALPKKGLFAMPFMRRALSRQRQEVAVEAEDILKAQELVDALPDGAPPEATPQDTSGRFSFNGENGNTKSKRKGKKPAADAVAPSRAGAGCVSTGGTQEDMFEGRYADDEDGACLRQKHQEASEKLQESSRKGEGVQRASVHKARPSMVVGVNGAVAVGMGGTAGGGGAEPSTIGRQAKTPEATPAATPAATSKDPAAPQHAAQAAPRAHDMREIINEAFAGDDVVADFEVDKAAAAQESVAAVADPSGLPGWGLWANRKREPQWLKDKKAAAEKQKAALLAKRKDAKLKGVIINEKWDKKAAKLTVTDLPFPYTRNEEYDRALRVPLGSETNTTAAFRNLTRPAVLKETGQIIAPLRKNASTLQAAASKKRSRAPIVVVAGGSVKMNRKH